MSGQIRLHQFCVSAVAVLATLGGAGCRDAPTAPRSGRFHIEPGHAWAGSAVEISALDEPFEAGDVVLRDADTLLVVEARATRAQVRLPTDANGRTDLIVKRNRYALGEAAVEAYGYVGARVYPDPIDDLITVLPMPHGVSVVGRSYERPWRYDSRGGFAWIYPSTGIHRRFPDAPHSWDLYRVGVDPVGGTIFHEFADSVHAGRIVGGELVDLGWMDLPCNRWSCETLAGDIWIFPYAEHTCRVAPAGSEPPCTAIYWGHGDDIVGIERLWSADVGVMIGTAWMTAFRLSTGELAYRIWPLRWPVSVVADEARGLFYVSGRGTQQRDRYWRGEILAIRGADGVVDRVFELVCPKDEESRSTCGLPDLGYDPTRDILYLLRGRIKTLEARDAETFELLGEVALTDMPDYWLDAVVLVDDLTDRVFLVFANARIHDPVQDRSAGIDGTPVLEVRPPPL